MSSLLSLIGWAFLPNVSASSSSSLYPSAANAKHTKLTLYYPQTSS